jgi:NitT/TauT family transport system substrate-binding protein
LQAFGEGLARLRSDPALVKDVMRRYTNTDDAEILDEGYQSLLRVAPRTPHPRVEALRVGLEYLAETTPAAVGVPPERFLDTTTVDALDREGFFARLNP